MASRYYALAVGGHLTDVAEGSSTQSKDVEIAIDLSTNSPTRIQVLNAIETIKNFITQDNWPPA